MKAGSLRKRINRWYAVLMILLAAGIAVSLMAAGHLYMHSYVQQELMRVVERNVDEVEIENGKMEIETDFAFHSSDVYCSVYTLDGVCLGGEQPFKLNNSEPFSNGETVKVRTDGNTCYIYDTLVTFNSHEYRINGITGEIISCETEYASAYELYNGAMDEKGEGCEITLQQAYSQAINALGVDSAHCSLVGVLFSDWNGDPVYDLDIYTDVSPYQDIWIRGISAVQEGSPLWRSIFGAAMLILPLIVILGIAVGSRIVGKALQPLNELNDTVTSISTGSDLSARVHSEHTDIELRGLQDNFNRMMDRLQSSFMAEKQFTSDASHELRTPVTVILAQCDEQLGRGDISEEERLAFHGIQQQALSMKKLISQLLSFTHMEQGREWFEFNSDNLSELVSAVCEDAAEIADRGIKVIPDIQPDVYMSMDIGLMTRLTDNLVSNAIKYGKENGTVRVSLKTDEGSIVLTVADDGIGISDEHIDKIWQRFYRVDKARSRSEGCSGLGLSMVKQIAALHGGTVSVSSLPGEGSTFTAVFPI